MLQQLTDKRSSNLKLEQKDLIFFYDSYTR